MTWLKTVAYYRFTIRAVSSSGVSVLLTGAGWPEEVVGTVLPTAIYP